jgi:hypothetical protein
VRIAANVTTRSKHNHGDRFAPSIAMATVASEQISASRAKPLRGAEGALDALDLLGK